MTETQLPTVAWDSLTGWQRRADAIPAGYDGPARYLSTKGAPAPTDMRDGDEWTKAHTVVGPQLHVGVQS